jgi:hypothetical protein
MFDKIVENQNSQLVKNLFIVPTIGLLFISKLKAYFA